MTQEYPVLVAASVSVRQFVEFWDRCYSGYDEDFYQHNVGRPLTPDLIEKWFIWKNGTPLSPLKAKSVLRYSSPEERLAPDVDDIAVRAFLLRSGGAIWRIFWLHVQHPTRFPIYDQHVHRAMAYLLGWDDRKISTHNPTKVALYLDQYRPFLRQFDGLPARRVDRALWAFGKFIAPPNYPAMLGVICSGSRGERELSERCL